MDLLPQPQAQPLLQEARLAAAAVPSCADHLETYLARYLPRCYRQEHRQHARTILRGQLTGLERKTTEPMAAPAGAQRRPRQLFVGAGGWDEAAVLGELRQHVRAERGAADAVFIRDPSGFPKPGTASCGGARPGGGRLGQVDNCQGGVFLAYARPRGGALREGRLDLPRAWAADAARRSATQVPAAVAFQQR
jgi:SRSO17 transposase